MAALAFDRTQMARWYARQHLKTDPGVVSVHYLPNGAGEREIRLVEVNNLIGELLDEAIEPISFGVDRGTDSQHMLVVLDLTPRQWERVQTGDLQLPPGWTVDGREDFGRNR